MRVRGGRAAAVVPALLAALALAPVLSGCDDRDDAAGAPGAAGAAGSTDPADPAGAAGATPPAGVAADPLIGEVATAPDVVLALQRALAHRAHGVLAGDQGEYDAVVAPRDTDFVAQQQQYYANLRQLPLQTFTLEPDPATLVRDGASYSVNVAVTVQLGGLDAVPVTSVDRYRFVPTTGGRRYRLASTTDTAWEQRNGVTGQPWDDGPIDVRAGTGVLGIFDPTSVGQAGAIVRSVETGIADVSAVVPYDWSRTVVVYALSDDSFLRSIPDLPGGDPEELDAVAYPVQASTTTSGATTADATVAGTRLVLHPRMLARTGASRDRLLRHELTHAAIGPHDDHAPTWLAEGLAEYVSVQAQAPEDRSIAKPALAAARAGLTDLPADEGFNGADSTVHYATGWWACEEVALTAGQPALWTLLDQLEALGAAGTLDRAGEDATLVSVTGMNARTLARKAGKLLVATFDPPPPPTPTPAPVDPLAPAPSAPGTVPAEPVAPPPA